MDEAKVRHVLYDNCDTTNTVQARNKISDSEGT